MGDKSLEDRVVATAEPANHQRRRAQRDKSRRSPKGQDWEPRNKSEAAVDNSGILIDFKTSM